MLGKINTFGVKGIGGYPVLAECYISGGLPNVDIVGLPDTAIREAKERIRAAIKNSGFTFPASRVTVNLAPANTKKEGTLYDLPITLGILSASGDIPEIPSHCAFIGELSLAGGLRGVDGVLPMAMSAARCGIKQLFVPAENAQEAALVHDIEIYPADDLRQIVDHFKNIDMIRPQPHTQPVLTAWSAADFAEVKGQENVKRAMEVAAAGGHNILLVGSPGSGKSMLAKRLPGILPDMTRAEYMQTTEIHSVAGLTRGQNGLVTQRPFRSPHHTVSAAAISGGGSRPKPGEVSLAHNGVLFLDELPEYHRDALEVLRQPIEDGQVTVSRASGSETFPSRFMLVCAMNPCRCGWYGHPSGRCSCTQQSVDNYLKRISGPLLDRIDIQVNVASVEYEKLAAKSDGESSQEIRRRVNAAREIQKKRFAGSDTQCNGQMTAAQTQRFCILDEQCTQLMKNAFQRLGLTARGYDKILRIARTIADLDGSGDIKPNHLAEAIQYKNAM